MKAGWYKKKLGEVCELVNGRAYRKPELLSEGKYKVLRVGNFFTNEHWYYSDLELEDKKFCDNGDLLYAWSASFGPRVWTGEKVIFHYHIWKVIPDFSQIDQQFLFYFLEWDKELLKLEKGAGTTMIHVSKGSMEERDILVPPLTEQQRIVAILDEAFEAISAARANAEQNRQNARALFESYLQSVFSQHGDEWLEKALEDTVDQYCSLSYGIVQPGDDMAEGLPIVRPTDLGIKVIELNGLKRIDANLAKSYRKTTLRGNDLLLCVRGTTGMLSIASQTLIGGNVTRGIVPIQFDKLLLSQEFGYYLMRSELVQSQIREKTYGTALMQINIRDLRKLTVYIPPLQEQAELVMKFDAIWGKTVRLESLYQRKIAALDELKQSLLQQAFSGQL